MLLVFAIVLAICSSILEFSIMLKSPALRKLALRYPLVGIVLSISLSWLLGMLFGAAGAIIMFAGVASTAMTAPVYVIANKAVRLVGAFRQRRTHAPALAAA